MAAVLMGGWVGLWSGMALAAVDFADTVLSGFDSDPLWLGIYMLALEVPLCVALGSGAGLWVWGSAEVARRVGGRARDWLAAACMAVPWTAFATWVPSGWIEVHGSELDSSGRLAARAVAPVLFVLTASIARVGIAAHVRVKGAAAGAPGLRAMLVMGGIVFAAAAYAADRRVLVGLYDDFHWGLLGLSASSLALAVATLCAGNPARWHGRGRGRALLGVVLVGLSALVGLEQVRPPVFGPSTSVVFSKLLGAGRGLTDFDGDGVSALLGGNDCDGFDHSAAPGNFDMPGNAIDEDCSGTAARWPPAAPQVDYPIPDARGMNVVLISIDTLRADHLGCYGYGRNTSPAIDQFAAGSLRFSRAFAPAPKTFDSFPALMSGLYASNLVRHYEHPAAKRDYRERAKRRSDAIAAARRKLRKAQVEGDERAITAAGKALTAARGKSVSKNWYYVADDLELLAETLQKRGYETAFFGAAMPLRSGLGRGYATAVDSRNQAKSARAFIDTQLQKRAAGEAKPFMLWLHYFAPHSTYVAHPGHDFGSAPIDRYDGEIAYVDADVGRVLAALDDSRLSSDTIVVLVADHGEEFREHGGEFHGRRLYREHVHVPLLLRVPGVAPAVVDDPVELVAVMPTFCDLLKLHPSCGHYDGRSLLANVAGTADPGRGAYSEAFQRDGELLVRSLYTPRWHLIQDFKRDRVELYDVDADWNEQRDVAALHPERTRELLDRVATRPLARQSHAVEAFRRSGDAHALADALPIFLRAPMLGFALDAIEGDLDARDADDLQRLAERPGLDRALSERAGRLTARARRSAR